MKKSTKIMIGVLCLIIVGLVSYIAMDKLVIEKNNEVSKNEEDINNVTSTNTQNKPSTTNTNKAIDYSKLNGNYTRVPAYETAPATLTIMEASEKSLKFEVSASSIRVNADESIQSAIDRGAVNIGGYEGTATKISENKWKCINTEDMEGLGKYEIILTLNNDNTIQIETKYDEQYGNVYCGNGVTLEGTYKKCESNKKEEAQNNNDASSGNEIRKKIYIGREGDSNDVVDMKLYSSSLGYEMYFDDSCFKIEKEENKDKYVWTTNSKCGINITKINKSISDITIDNYDTYDIAEGEDTETIVTTKFDSKTKIYSNTRYICCGDNLTYAIEVYYPQEDKYYTELAEGIGVEMMAMINTFENK